MRYGSRRKGENGIVQFRLEFPTKEWRLVKAKAALKEMSVREFIVKTVLESVQDLRETQPSRIQVAYPGHKR